MNAAPVDAIWPEELRPFVYEDQLQLRSNGPHAYTWLALPFGTLLVMMAFAQVVGVEGVAQDFLGWLAALFALVFGGACLLSCAYSAWGHTTLHRQDGAWVIRRRLWRWSRTSVVATSEMRFVEIYHPSPAAMAFPGSAGSHVRITIRRTESFVEIGAGLCLPKEVLEAINDMLRKSCGLA